MKRISLSIFILVVTTFLCAELVTLNPYADQSISVDVLENNGDYTIIKLRLNHFLKKINSIDNKEFLQLQLPSEGHRLEVGNPELPIVARSIIIPPTAKMNWEIISSSHHELNGMIAPSKGILYRNINPETVPYYFSDVYQKDSFFPENLVELSEPYLLREMRGIAIRVSPFAYNHTTQKIRVYEEIVIKIFADGTDSINSLNTRNSKITKDFEQIYQKQFINYSHEKNRYNPISEQGSLLVICYPDFMEAMKPYVQWKKQKGIPTVMIPVTEAGSTGTQIQSFIQKYFNENPNLSYIQLVGDATQVPTINYSSYSSDPTYVMLVGSDSYPDAYIGRFSAENVAHVKTQVERTIHYERDLDDGKWLSKAMGIAGNEPGGHYGEKDFQHIEKIRKLLLTGNYESADQFYQTPNTESSIAPTESMVSNAFNEGRGITNYIAHGLWNGWGFQYGTGSNLTFSNSHVNNLTNDWKLPFIVSVACDVGIFHNQTCFAETWLRATNKSNGNPTGAIATYMASMSQPWTPPMYAQDHINELIVNESKFTIGGLFFSGSCFMLDYSKTVDFINTMRTWHIFGDASLMIRTTSPKQMVVQSASVINMEAADFEVLVDSPGAMVTLYCPDTQTILGTGIVDATGKATVQITEQIHTSGSLLLTTTAFNKVTNVKNIIIGSTTEPVFGISPSSNNFGNVDLFSISEPRTFTIGNYGVGNIIIDSITLEDDDHESFVLSNQNNMPITLKENESVTFNVTFEPFLLGEKSTKLKISHNTKGSPFQCVISGVGIEPCNSTDFRLGNGDNVHSYQDSGPINIYYQSIRGQFVYTKEELNSVGISGKQKISKMGFYVTSAPICSLPDYHIRLKHTAAKDASEHDSGLHESKTVIPFLTLNPSSLNVFDLDEPFFWDGENSILFDTAFAVTPNWDPSGVVKTINASKGYRFVRGDEESMVDVETKSTYGWKPQVMIATETFVEGLPNCPNLSLPSQNATNVSVNPTFIWYASSTGGTVTSFRLQVSSDHDFTNNVIDEVGLIASTYTLPARSTLSSNQTYYWRVIASNSEGTCSCSDNIRKFSTGDGVSTDDPAVPIYKTELSANYPNPFNPSTTIKFGVANSKNNNDTNLQKVQIEIFNIKGQKIRTLVNDYYPAGQHSVIFNGLDDFNRPISSGVYLYRMVSKEFSETKKMILIK